MTTDETQDLQLSDQMAKNLVKIEGLSQRLVAAMVKKKDIRPSLQGPGAELFTKAGQAAMAEAIQNPTKIFETQISFWGKTLNHYMQAQAAFAAGNFAAPQDDQPKDRRFANPMWESNPYFNFIKQQFQINSDAIRTAVGGLDDLDDRDRKRLTFFSEQIIDMFSPTNFLATNPDALTKAVETEGQSLVTGLENFIADIEANKGDLLVSLADKNAFTVGEDIGTTPGSVVFRNELFELIQYTPTTETVYKKPLVIFPPWINKFYIMDLKPQNSLIKYIVDQGVTLFVVSWVNPDMRYAETGLSDYVQTGYLEALRVAAEITGEDSVNAVGYCIAGTTLSLTLSYLKRMSAAGRGKGLPKVNAATFFTTMTDFKDQGEFGVFLDDDFVDGIEEECNENGVLASFFMSRTFSYLRANDLIYQPAVKSYLMGETPPAFDLLFWNGDGTNLPGKMTVQYLRGLCQRNEFVDGGFEMLGHKLHISDVDVPLCAIACEADHIAAWTASYRGVQQMGSKDKTFILSQSGHIAGIINPPSKKKYGHYTHADMGVTSDDWRAAAEFHEGSWWGRWIDWLGAKSGDQVPARTPGDSSYKALTPAPGTYVKAIVDLRG